MKRICLAIMMLAGICMTMLGQTKEFQKAVARYKGHSVTAVAQKTVHKAAVAKDVVTKGTLTMKQPDEVSIMMEGGKDGLTMKGSKFIMTVNGKQHKTSSDKNAQFVTFQAVFEDILAGGVHDLQKYSDLTMTKQGNLVVLTITPQAESKKAQRRLLFTSIVITIDTKTSELRSLRMNEKAGNYTDYTFTKFAIK